MSHLSKAYKIIPYAAITAALFSLAYFFQNLYIHLNGLILGSPVYKSNSDIPAYLINLPPEALPSIKIGANIFHITLNIICGIILLRIHTRGKQVLAFYAVTLMLTAIISFVPALMSLLSDQMDHSSLRANGLRILRSPLLILLALTLALYTDFHKFRKN